MIIALSTFATARYDNTQTGGLAVPIRSISFLQLTVFILMNIAVSPLNSPHMETFCNIFGFMPTF
ncbi:hypothetical protein ABIE13_005420 [Ottowia thiooxydans]|uniref:Uncharacterized protein n=1 Tax=Ottowia thiooxydans TaxID=219182 RepID=A0ABV2QGU9_9BURK